MHPGELKDIVASPAGTTIAGIHIMERRGSAPSSWTPWTPRRGAAGRSADRLGRSTAPVYPATSFRSSNLTDTRRRACARRI
jgi:hypothetical protein